jgi:long-chain acyl-CoA synthetase
MSAPLLAAWQRCRRAQPRARILSDAATAQSWTRADLDQAADEWCRRHGGDLERVPVVLAEPNGFGWLTVFLGLLKAGAIAVALDPAEPEESRRRLAREIRAGFLWDGRDRQPVAGGVPRRTPACLIKLTSGSTGSARAYRFTEAQILADGHQICATMGIRPQDLNLGLIPFGHSYGLGNLVAPLLAQGTAVLTGVPPLPQAIAAAVEHWRPTVFPAVPPLLRALAESDIPGARLRSLRTIISAGAPLAPALAANFFRRFRRKIHSFYGSSETGGITYDRTGGGALSGRSVGRPLRGVTVTMGPAGRFWVQSAAVHTIGNRQRRAHHGRYCPPDIGRLTNGGELTLLGRSGRLLKIAARRLDPREVEGALRRLAGVRDAWVATTPTQPDTLAVVLAGTIDPEQARAGLRLTLASWKIPRRWIQLPEFPLTARGKPDLRKLRELLAG